MEVKFGLMKFVDGKSCINGFKAEVKLAGDPVGYVYRFRNPVTQKREWWVNQDCFLGRWLAGMLGEPTDAPIVFGSYNDCKRAIRHAAKQQLGIK